MPTTAIRALAAVRFYDRATGSTVTSPLRVEARAAEGVRNRSGLWVIRSAQGVPLDDPEAVPAQSVTVSARVSDPSGRYLARSFAVALPRVAHAADDLFQPIDIELPPSPAAPLRSSWASVRVSVAFDGGGPAIEGALVRLHSAELGLRCVTLSDARGEALLIGPGIRPFSAADGEDAVLQPALEHSIELVVDLAATDPQTGRRTTTADPDELWDRRLTLQQATRIVSLTAGREQIEAFEIPMS